MKKIMTAALGLSLLTGTVVFAQNTATTSSDSSTGKKMKKKMKKGKTKTGETTATK